jgi:hypothetical protein
LLQFDEEDYESMGREVLAPNIEALAAELKKSLEVRAQVAAATQHVPSAQAQSQTLETICPQNKPVTKTAQHPATLPLRGSKSQAARSHPSDEYNSEEYESLKENVSAGAWKWPNTSVLA